jgi:hypothetical protein
VLRRVLDDEEGLAGVDALDGHPVRGRQRDRVEVRGHHVVETGQRVEVQLLVVVHGRVVAQPPVDGEGVVRHRAGEGVVLDHASSNPPDEIDVEPHAGSARDDVMD